MKNVAAICRIPLLLFLLGANLFAQAPAAPPLDPATIKLAEALIAAPDEAALQALLQNNAALKTPDLVRAISDLGHTAYDNFDLVTADKRYRLSLQLAIAFGDKSGQGKAHMNIGNIHMRAGRNTQAIEEHKQALAIFDSLDDKKRMGLTWRNIGIVYTLMERYEEAIEAYNRGLSLSTQADDKVGQAEVLSLRSSAFSLQLKYEQAKESITAALLIYEALSDKKGQAEQLRRLGNAAYEQQDYPQAILYLQRALQVSRETDDLAVQGTILTNLGESYKSKSDYPQAIAAFGEAIQLLGRTPDKMSLALVYGARGNAYSAIGDLSQAIKEYEQALQITEEIKYPDGAAFNRQMIGQLQAEQGNYQEALRHFQHALKWCEENNLSMQKGQILSGIGGLYEKQGSYVLALSYHTQALQIAEQQGEKRFQAFSLISLGAIYHSQKRPSLALEHLQKAAKLFEELKFEGFLAATMGIIGQLYLDLGEFEKAREQFDQMLGLYRKGDDQGGQAETMNAIGLLLATQKSYEQALKEHLNALAIYEAAGAKRNIAHALSMISDVYARQADWRKALEYEQRALAIRRELGGQLFRLAGSISSVGLYQRRLQEPEKAAASFEEAIRILETQRSTVVGGETQTQDFFAKALAEPISPYVALLDLRIAQNNLPAAFDLAERTKARTLTEVLQNGRSNLTKDLTPQEQQQEQQLNAQLISLNKQLYLERTKSQPDGTREKELTARLSKAQAEFDNYQTQLYAAHPQLRTQRAEAKPLTLTEATAFLSEANTAVLEFVTHPDKTFLFVLTKGTPTPKMQVFTLPLTQASLTEKVKAWQAQMARNATSGQTDPDYHPALRTFYDLLLKPAEAAFAGKTNLIIVPDGPLWELPFQALQTPRRRFLLEEATIAYAPSLTFLRDRATLRADKSAPNRFLGGLLALGVSDFSSSIQGNVQNASLRIVNLPDVVPTVEGISRFYAPTRRKIFLNQAATEEAFKAEAAHYRILQFMTHGLLNDQSPLYSQIVLTPAGKNSQEDGLLEARELLPMNLHAELAILGACDTGRGGISNGEGVIGLTWAFLVAGVPNTVVSQWSVNSAATKELMIEFHRQLTTKPQQSKAESLRQASLKLMRSEKFYAPYYWASFVLVGDGK